MGLHGNTTMIIQDTMHQTEHMASNHGPVQPAINCLQGMQHIVELRINRKKQLHKDTCDMINKTAQQYIEAIQTQQNKLLHKLTNTYENEALTLVSYLDELKKLVECTEINSPINGSCVDNTECEEILTRGNCLLQQTQNQWIFKECREAVQLGHFVQSILPNTEEQVKPTNYTNTTTIPSVPACHFPDSFQVVDRRRSNTISHHLIGQKYDLNLRRVRSTNDLVCPGPEMSCVFQMSNEDLNASFVEVPSHFQAKVHFRISAHGWDKNQITEPCDVAFLPNGEFMVTEKFNKRIQVFNPHKGLSVRLMQSGLIQPLGITLTADGFIAVADQMSNTITALRRSGDNVCQFGKGYFKEISFIASLSNHNFVVIDNMGPWQQYVFIYNPMTGQKTRLGFDNKGNYILNRPEYVHTDKNNNIIITDSLGHCVWVYDVKGRIKFKFGSHGDKDGELREPKSVCTTDQGHFLVADSGNNRICLFDRCGEFVKTLLTGDDGLSSPQVVQFKDCYMIIIQHTEVIGTRLLMQ